MKADVVLLALVALLTGARAIAVPPPVLKDHPMVSPYEGSKLFEHLHNEFDSMTFPLDGATKKDGPKLTLEGKFSRLSYQNPPQRSTLEVFRNYQQSLARAGFTVVKELGGAIPISSGHSFVGALDINTMSVCYSPEAEKSHFQLSVKTIGNEKVHVAVFVAPCKPDKTFIWVIEGKPMEGDKVSINANSMAEALDRDGHVALYGIPFDFNQAEIKPEAIPTLEEIAKLLMQRPTLGLHVVGHTDWDGELQYNVQLSQKRAAAVVQWLATQKKIAATRLTAHGMGPLAPKATNATEQGKALNRRVELIQRR